SFALFTLFIALDDRVAQPGRATFHVSARWRKKAWLWPVCTQPARVPGRCPARERSFPTWGSLRSAGFGAQEWSRPTPAASTRLHPLIQWDKNLFGPQGAKVHPRPRRHRALPEFFEEPAERTEGAPPHVRTESCNRKDPFGEHREKLREFRTWTMRKRV